jgi:NADH:ubiquinone oxidoreductase subunit 3 (subunit A)
MNTYTNKPDIAQLAKEDLGSSFTNWNSHELKPGEKKIVKYYQHEKIRLEKEIKNLNDTLSTLNIAYEKAVEYKAEDSIKWKSIEKEIHDAETRIEKLQSHLEALIIKRGKLEDAIKLHLINNPELKERESNAIAHESSETKVIPPKRASKGFLKTFLPVLLVLFCMFDGTNMFINLNNYSYDNVRHGFISIIIFVAVLFTSFGVKAKNSWQFWLGFIVFLTLANVPQFLGKDPKFGLSNLTNSPEHIVIFVLSFFGSIIVTMLNLSLKEKKEVVIAENVPVQKVETEASKNLGKLYVQFDATNISVAAIEAQISEGQNELTEKRKKFELDTTTSSNERVQAIETIITKQAQITSMMDNLNSGIADLPEKCHSLIIGYREEIYFLKLANGMEKPIIYEDLQSITI